MGIRQTNIVRQGETSIISMLLGCSNMMPIYKKMEQYNLQELEIIKDFYMSNNIEYVEKVGLQNFGMYSFIHFSGRLKKSLNMMHIKNFWFDYKDRSNWVEKDLDGNIIIDYHESLDPYSNSFHGQSITSLFKFYLSGDFAMSSPYQYIDLDIVPRHFGIGADTGGTITEELLSSTPPSEYLNDMYGIRNLCYWAIKIGLRHGILIRPRFFTKWEYTKYTKPTIGIKRNKNQTKKYFKIFDMTMIQKHSYKLNTPKIEYDKNKITNYLPHKSQIWTFEGSPSESYLGGGFYLFKEPKVSSKDKRLLLSGKKSTGPVLLNDLQPSENDTVPNVEVSLYRDQFQSVLPQNISSYQSSIENSSNSKYSNLRNSMRTQKTIHGKIRQDKFIYEKNNCGDMYAYNYKPGSAIDTDCYYLNCENNLCPSTHVCLHNQCVNYIKIEDVKHISEEDMSKIITEIISSSNSIDSNRLIKTITKNKNNFKKSAKNFIVDSVKNSTSHIKVSRNKLSGDEYYDSILNTNQKLISFKENRNRGTMLERKKRFKGRNK